MYNSLHYRMILLHSICQVLHLYSLGEEYDKSGKKVCRNTRCAFFFFIDYKNRLIFLSCDILRISLIYAFSTSK